MSREELNVTFALRKIYMIWTYFIIVDSANTICAKLAIFKKPSTLKRPSNAYYISVN